jgi:hypothetical protein
MNIRDLLDRQIGGLLAFVKALFFVDSRPRSSGHPQYSLLIRPSTVGHSSASLSICVRFAHGRTGELTAEAMHRITLCRSRVQGNGDVAMSAAFGSAASYADAHLARSTQRLMHSLSLDGSPG